MTRIALTSMPKVALALASAISAPVSAMAEIRALCIDGTTRPLFFDDPEQELECYGVELVQECLDWMSLQNPACWEGRGDPDTGTSVLNRPRDLLDHDWGSDFEFAHAEVIQ